jgi:hypothetical protein
VVVNHRLDWTDSKIRGELKNLSSLIMVESPTTRMDCGEVSREIPPIVNHYSP